LCNVDLAHLRRSSRRTFCEWKGATYADVKVDGDVTADACWSFADPSRSFGDVAKYWAFYAQLIDECWVDDQRVDGCEGGFYGGWITSNVTGPFKGTPGTALW